MTKGAAMPNMSKIRFTIKCLSWCLFMPVAGNGQEVPPLFPGSPFKLWETQKITDDVYGFRYSFYRDIFIVTDEGVIATDPLNAEAAVVLQQEIHKITDKPVKYVAYSHSHWDHVSGGQVFKDEGAQFVAHERCAANFLENPNPDVVTPDITYKDQYTITLGEKSLEMFYFGPAHDNCLVAMLVQPANMLFLVDVANPPSGWTMFYNPAVSEDRVWNMVAFFDGIQDLIDERGIEAIIGAHMNYGPVDEQSGRPTMVQGMTGPATIVAERRLFWKGMIDAVREELAAGIPAMAVPDVLVEKELFADRVLGYEPEKMRILLRRITSYAQTGE